MKKIVLFSLLALLFFPRSGMADSSEEQLLVRPLDPSKFNPGIGCSFWRADDEKQRSIYEDYDGKLKDGPWMNISGKTVKLAYVSKASLPTDKGKQSTLRLSAEHVVVVLDIKQTSSNDCGGEPCVGASYDGTLTITAGKNKESIKITGGCGD